MRIISLNRRRIQSGGATPPPDSISIIAPSENTIYSSVADVTINCSIVGTPSSVEYYDGVTLIGTRSVAPFDTFTWTTTPDGTNPALSAKLFVGGVEAATSNTVNITISAPASGYDADFQAKIDYATANTIPVPPTAELDVLNQRVLDFKAANDWTKVDGVYDYNGVGATFIPFRLIDIKRRVLSEAFGSITWLSDGAEGNGANAYIDPKFNPAVNGVNFTQNNAGYFYVGRKNPNEGKCIVGAFGGSTNGYNFWVPTQLTSKTYLSINALSDSIANSISHIGLNGLYRSSFSSIKAIGASTENRTINSSGFPNVAIYLLARNRADLGGSADLFSTERIGMFGFGADTNALHAATATAIA